MISQRKKPAQRLFSGLAGSPLAQIKEAPLSGAERSARFQERRRQALAAVKTRLETLIEDLAPKEPPVDINNTDPQYWNSLLVKHKLSVSRGATMTDAPRGLGRLVTGGFDSGKIAEIVAAHDRDENSRRCTPEGIGAHDHEMSKSGGKKGSGFAVNYDSPEIEVAVQQVVEESFQDLPLTMRAVFDANGVEIGEVEDEHAKCLICGEDVGEFPRKHIENVHGDLVAKLARKNQRAENKLARAAKKAADAAYAEQKHRRLEQSIAEGLTKKPVTS